MERLRDLAYCLLFVILVVLGFALFGCGAKRSSDGPTTSAAALLQNKYDSYNSLMLQQTVDPNGFVDVKYCDSLLETSLANPAAELSAAEVESGRWLRRPVSYPECYASKGSSSDISRDMLLGVMYRCFISDNVDCLHRLWDYGSNHTWIMGKEGKTTIFSPDYIALLAQEIYVLSNGASNYTVRIFTFPQLVPASGYEAQLQVIFSILREKAYKVTTPLQIELYNKLADQNPNNPLMLAAAGRYTDATNLLLNNWPNGRLPTTSDWCSNWLLSDAPDSSGRQACPTENETHSGGDLLLPARLILGIEPLSLR